MVGFFLSDSFSKENEFSANGLLCSFQHNTRKKEKISNMNFLFFRRIAKIFFISKAFS